VFAANSGARRFYERLGAVAVEHQLIEVVPGIAVPEVCYWWQPAPAPHPSPIDIP
jgi:hypothetical protein